MFNIFLIKNIELQRIEQLKLQEKLDNKLAKLDCKNEIIDYFIFNRYITRLQQLDIINSNIFDKISIIDSQVKKNDDILNNLNNILNSDDPCKLLNNKINKKNDN